MPGFRTTGLRALVCAVVLCAAGWPTCVVSAGDSPQPATTATAMGQLAASMAPGTWAELPTQNMVPTLEADGIGGSILDYAEDGGWDPVTEQFFFIGCDHPYDANGDLARFVAYSAVTNSWRVLPDPYWFPNEIMHGYDHNAIDASRGAFYHRQYSLPDVYRYDIAAGTWSHLPTIPTEVMGYSACCMGLEYFPELNGLVLAGSTATGTPDQAYLYSDTTGQWSRIAENTPMGTYNHFVEYNPVHHLVLYGGGNDNRQIYSISSTGVVSSHPNAPISLGILESIVTVDPVSGDFLVLGQNGEFYSYDILTETWIPLPGPVPVFSPIRGTSLVWQTLATPISNYGVTMFVKFYWADPTSSAWVYLYKHAESSNIDTVPPTDPTSLSAVATGTTQISLTWNASTDSGGSGLAGYTLERCQGAGCTGFAQIDSPATNDFLDSGLTANTTYRYRTRAVDGAGNLSGYSNVAAATTLGSGGSNGLVAAYPLNEGSGSVVIDASGNTNTGTISGASWNTTGKFGGSLTFKGGNDQVVIQNAASLDLSGGMTLEAWVFPTSSQAAWRPVIQRDPDAYLLDAGSSAAALRPLGGGRFSGTSATVASPSAIPVNQWSHLATTWDGASLRLYVNGAQVASAPRPGTLTTTAGGAGAVRLGSNGAGQRFVGRIDEVRIYDHALTQGEIATDMTLPVGITVPGPPGVPDGVSGPAMIVSKNDPSGNSLGVSWSTATCPGSAGYRIVYGGGAQLPTALGGTLGTTGAICSASSNYTWASPSTTIDPKGLVWWFVEAVDAMGVEGSWGRDGAGTERAGTGPGGSSGLCGTPGKNVVNACGS